jgi:hypothetical protein
MEAPMSANKVTVTVQYVGQVDFTDEVPPAQLLQAIKVHAMKKFGLEPGAESRYGLSLNGTELSDQTHVGDLGNPVVLTLALLHEVAKGA